MARAVEKRALSQALIDRRKQRNANRQDEAYRQANAGGSVSVWLSLNHSAEQRVEHRKPECRGDERVPCQT